MSAADVAAGAGVLSPGATIGILGGGQLGRMLALAAATLGFRCHVFCPEPDSPAFDVVRETTVAPYDDEAALARFAEAVDVVTYEFENVPLGAARAVAARRPLYPDVTALATTQDRLAEKEFVGTLGIATADYRAVDDAAAVAAALADLGPRAVLKSRRFGYDGKGQAMLGESGLDAAVAWERIGGRPAILERLVPFACEISVVAARGRDGSLAAYEPIENHHSAHVLRRSTVPAAITPAAATEAEAIARRIAEALDYVGVLAVEMFVLRAGDTEHVIVNEIAPRVHNSGHWTIEGALASQFEQHVRAIAGWPLGSTARAAPMVEMVNLLGEEVAAWRRLAAEPGAHLHLYGKAEPRPGRKMGHVTRLRP